MHASRIPHLLRGHQKVQPSAGRSCLPFEFVGIGGMYRISSILSVRRRSKLSSMLFSPVSCEGLIGGARIDISS